MPPDNSEGPVVGWSDEELLATAKRNFGVGTDADLPDDVRFLGGVVRLIGKRLARAGEEEDEDPAIFFLAPSGPESIDRSSLRSAPMLDNGMTSIGGHLWFVGPAVVQGHAVEVDQWSDEDVFSMVDGDLHIGDIPAVLFDPRTHPAEARYYPHGLGDGDEVRVLPLGGTPIRMEDVLAVVDRAHVAHLVTPAVQSKAGKLWFKAAKLWPAPDAEDRIQLVLKAHLQGAFPSTIVREEQIQATGRLDLEIEEASPGGNEFVRHALLELKVLRSYRSTGSHVSAKEIRDWVKDGVTQAASYRDERDVKASALCCFDMRETVSGEACFRPVKRLAEQRRVRLCVWHIFASSKAYREALA